MKTNKEEVLFVIDEFKVIKGRTYLVKDRKDGDAPSGFVKAGVSKLPSDGVGESVHCGFIPSAPGSSKGSWDTGFYADSPCYKNQDESVVKQEVKTRTEKVLKPYRTAVGDPEAFALTNPASMDETAFDIWSGRTYNTDQPIEVMALYMTLLSRQAAPMGAEGSAKYRECSYLIVDTKKAVKDKDEVNVSIMGAVTLFAKLYDIDKEKLDVVLTWVGMDKYPANADRDTISSIFFENIKDSLSRCSAFIEAVEETDNNIARDKMYIYKKLKETSGRSTKIVTSNSGKLYYDDFELGGDLKTAAENIAKNPDLGRIKKEIMTGEFKEEQED